MVDGLCVKCHAKKAKLEIADEVFGSQFVCDECYCVVRVLENLAVLKVLSKQKESLDLEIGLVKANMAMFMRDLKKGAKN